MPISNKDSTILYSLYCLCGGMYFYDRVPRKLRKIYFCINVVFVFLLDCVAAVGYFLTVRQPKALDIAFVLYMTEGTLYVFIFVPLIFYYYRDQLETFLQFTTDDEFAQTCEYTIWSATQREQYRTEKPFFSRRKHNILSVLLIWTAIELSLLSFFIILPLIDLMFETNKHQFIYQDLLHHLIPIPYLSEISSQPIFLVVYAIESFFMTYSTVTAITFPNFIIISAYQTSNKIRSYCRQLRAFSTNAVPSDIIQPSINLHNTHTQRNQLEKKIENQLKSFIKEYQHFKRVLELVQPCVNLFCSLVLIVNVTVQLAAIYIVLQTNLRTLIKVKQIIMAITFAIYFYSMCLMGHELEKMHEAIIYEVYNTPWYNFTPKLRKLVNIFQYHVGHVIHFKSFNIFAVNLQTFPQELKAIYTIVNIFRRLIKT